MDYWTTDRLEGFFYDFFESCVKKMVQKNHDYGNSWYEDETITILDTIRHKLDRIKNIEKMRLRGEEALVHEGVDQELIDICNYCVFAMIKFAENKNE